MPRIKESVDFVLAGLWIATMIVKDVVQDMLDDDMIIQEKVGTQVLYWIFPSQSYVIVLAAKCMNDRKNENWIQ